MKIYWNQSQNGAELLLQNGDAPSKADELLGAVELSHGYARPWAYNHLRQKVHLQILFAEKIDQAKGIVLTYLKEKGIFKPEPLPENQPA